MQSQRKALWTVAAIIFAVALHPARTNAQGGGAPPDPQIVGIVEAADQIDINYAKLAMSKAKDKQVKDFAQQMITDHSAVQKAVRDLAAKLNVTPADSETSNALKTQAQQTTQKLRGLKGKEFEKAYIDNEVAYHKAVINATKTVLIPSAQNAELKAALQGAEPLFEGHLQHAEHVQSAACHRLITEARSLVCKADPSVAGFNVGINSGQVVGQTVMHCHIHLIPRRAGDHPNPRGGVRGVIPGKADYNGSQEFEDA
jgi:putative membrane protein